MEVSYDVITYCTSLIQTVGSIQSLSFHLDEHPILLNIFSTSQ